MFDRQLENPGARCGDPSTRTEQILAHDRPSVVEVHDAQRCAQPPGVNRRRPEEQSAISPSPEPDQPLDERNRDHDRR